MAVDLNGELIPGGGGDNIPLIRNELTIGRRETCDICLRFPNVSGQHCQLSFKDGFWTITDLGSKNGVKVGGIKVKRKTLRDGDEINIASRVFTIRYKMLAGHQTLEEILDDEENIMAVPLLERAGLERPKNESELRRTPPASKGDYYHLKDEDD